MHEFYALYNTVVAHDRIIEKIAAISIELPNGIVIALHLCCTLSGLLVIWLLLAGGVVSIWASAPIGIPTYSYQGHHIIELSRVLKLAVIGVTRGDTDASMQGMMGAIQSSHARTLDTRVVSSWPTAHSNTAMNT